MLTIVSIFLTFVLTGVVGNILVLRWQHRNWMNQQKFLGEEKQYNALTQLWDEFTTLASRRLWRMRRLFAACNDGNEKKIEERRSEYESIVSEWNENLNSISARLTLYTSWHFQQQALEHGLQIAFVNVGAKLERLVKSCLAGRKADPNFSNRIRRDLGHLSRQLFVFSRDTLRMVQEQRARTYYGIEVPLNSANLETFGNWELLKALFKPGVEPFRVVRSAVDLSPPFGAGDNWPRIHQHSRKLG